MNFRLLLRKGLLGYQPIFFPNGVITGAGYQFFGNFRQAAMAEKKEIPCQNQFADNDKSKFNLRGLGNLYIPAELIGEDELDSDCYYRIYDNELPQFVADNQLLKRIYEHFVATTVNMARSEQVQIDSMIEIGSNTCLFPLEFSKHGVVSCHGADIVDYSEVVSILSVLNEASVEFHHMPDDSDATWLSLPKVDLVWSYAVLLHQANPLVHLTRLASKARKAIFVMTNCGADGDWGKPDDMAIKYCSANSYYAAGFPNCFDVTIVSPALLQFSLQRLGFSKVFELPYPEFKHGSRLEQENFNGWMKKHRCFLALRDIPLDDVSLDDYSVEPERSPYNGEDVRVYRGYHNNVFLKSRRYFIVPHDRWITKDYEELRSFSSLSRAIVFLEQQEEEKAPFPVLVEAIDEFSLVRFKNRYFLCPKQMVSHLGKDCDMENLHVLDSLEKWASLRSQTRLSVLLAQPYVIQDLVNNVCIARTPDGEYFACQIELDGRFGECLDRAANFSDIRKRTVTAELLGQMRLQHEATKKCFRGEKWGIDQTPDGFVVLQIDSGSILSIHSRYDEAWLALVEIRDLGAGEC